MEKHDCKTKEGNHFLHPLQSSKLEKTMGEENQMVPILSPAAKVNPRSDEELAAIKPKTPTHQKKSNKCLVYFLTAIVILSATLLVFALVVMRPSNPDAEFTSFTVKNLNYVYGTNTSFPFFNITLQTDVKIKNPNFGRFKFDNSTARVLYRTFTVGEAVLGEGSVEAKETKIMEVMVDLRSNNGSYDTKSLSSDMNSGILNLSSHASLSGRVILFKIFKKRRPAHVDCTMNLNFHSRSIQDLVCN